MKRMGEERIPGKIIHPKMERKLPRGRSRTRWTDQIRKDMEMRGKIGKKYEKGESLRIETSVDFSVIVDHIFVDDLKMKIEFYNYYFYSYLFSQVIKQNNCTKCLNVVFCKRIELQFQLHLPNVHSSVFDLCLDKNNLFIISGHIAKMQ